MSETVSKTMEKLNISSPYVKKRCWVHTSGNENALLALCSVGLKKKHDVSGELPRRIVLIEGGSGSGISSLLTKAQSMLTQRGHKVIFLTQGTEADERYILSNLVEELRTPYTRWAVNSEYLSPVHKRVLALRQYDFILVDDFQRFLGFSKRIASSNLKYLAYLSQLFPDCCLVIGGKLGSITAVADYLRSFQPVIYRLGPMGLDNSYIDFVRDVRRNIGNRTPFSDSEAAELYFDTKGLVGETFEFLDLLKAGPSASTAQNIK